MNLSQIARQLDLENLTPDLDLDSASDVSVGYASDLLSDVLAGAPAGSVLVTVQIHLNVIAVAVHADLAAVIFAANRRPEPPVIEKALAEKIPLLVSRESAFEIVGRLYELGVKGPRV